MKCGISQSAQGARCGHHRCQGRKAVKALREKLDAEIVAHTLTTTELNKQKEDVAWKEGTITSLQELP